MVVIPKSKVTNSKVNSVGSNTTRKGWANWRSEFGAFFPAFGEKFSRDRTTTLAASLAFYTVLSLAPLSVLILFAFSQLDQSLIDRFANETAQLVGTSGGSAVLAAIESARARPATGGLASLISFLVVLVSSGAMFSEVRDSLSIVFENAEPTEMPSSFIGKSWSIIRTRLLSAGFAITVVLIMAISLVLSAFLTAIAQRAGMASLDILISFALYAAIFTLLFMYGTSPGLKFRNAVRGGIVTSVLFIAGKILIGFYVGNSTIANSYGAAGSVVALLLWIYWASFIVFSGAQVSWLISEKRYRTYGKPASVLNFESKRK
ncbi:MAG: YihY/virulence factor BrkB family protein [Bdellovibrionota bacterium]